MNKKRILFGAIISAIFLIWVLSAVEASFVYYNNSILKDYTAGEIINGKFNLSFQDQPADSIFTSNFPGEITLLELIAKSSLEEGLSEGEEYNCTIRNCASDYAAKNEISSSLNLGVNEKKLIGFNISGEDASIQSIKLKLTSDASASCYGQIGLDILDNQSYAFRNTKYLDERCGIRNVGCFDEAVGSEIAELTRNQNSPYCENITLPAAPAYKIGAKIYNSTKNTNAPITAEMYDSNWNLVGSCTFSNHTTHFEELKCIVETSRTSQQGYLICLSAKSGVESNYTIPTEQQSPVCGNSERGSKEFTRDYFIFAEALKYDTAKIELNENNFNKITGKNLLSTLNGYLEDTYDSNCKQGCSIPLPILSGLEQNVNIQEAEIKYNTKGTLITSSKLYSLESRNSSLNSGPINLDIGYAKFTIPKNTNEKQFNLYLGGTRVFLPININIMTSFDFDIQPRSLAIGFPTLFKIILTDNVSSVVWNFGDGTTQTSQGKNITHTYKDQKKYQLEIKATRAKDGVMSTKKFEIDVSGAKESSKKLLDESEKKAADLEKQISAYPSWVSKEIEKRVNTSEMKKKILELKTTQTQAKTDAEYVKIVQDILALSIPTSVSSSIKGSEPLITGLANADFSYIKKLSGQTSGDNAVLKKDILNWTEENYDAIVEREVISLFSEAAPSPIATKFSIKITKRGQKESPAYLIIAIPKNHASFEKSYGEKEIKTESGEGVWISIDKSENINFAVPEDISLISVGAYLSPDIKALSKIGKVKSPEENPSRIKWAIFWIFLLSVVVLIVYIILQEWYKKRYESHLFANKDDLYNIINFIYNARASGVSGSEIRNKLGESSWKGEQISYAFKKIDGKRTGMWEIPLLKFMENKKVKEEIEKRQGRLLDTSFIKRPGF